jgi:nucleoside-diphosphate-sugar epimerase
MITNTMDSRKKILVFGGTGFIGSEFMKILMANSDAYEIYLLMHTRGKFREYEGIKIITGNLSGFNLSWLKKINPDYIVHMARMQGRGKLGRFLAAKRGANANKRIINYLLKNNLHPRIIYVSGSLVYGSVGEKIVREDQQLSPTSFAEQYILAERPWMECLKNKSLPVSIVRPPWIVGQGSWFKHFFLDQIKYESKVPLIGEGNNWMSVISLQDCAGLIYHCLNAELNNIFFNICMPGIYIKMKDFVAIISESVTIPVQSYSTQQAKKLFGAAATAAFQTSLRLHTNYEDIYLGYRWQHFDIESIIKSNLRIPVNHSEV